MTDRKSNILRAAREVFCEFGYEKTTVEEIARRIHKAKTAVYYYYSGKADIFRAVVQNEFEKVIGELSRHMPSPSDDNIPAHLREYLKMRMELLTGSPLHKKFGPKIFQGYESESNCIINQERGKFDDWEKAIFRKIYTKGNELGILSDRISPEPFADMLEMLLKGVEVQYLASKDTEASRSTYNEMVDFLIRDSETRQTKI